MRKFTWSTAQRLGLSGLIAAAILAGAARADERAQEERWDEVRAVLFDKKPMADGKNIIELHAPSRAVEAAIVPVSFTVKFPQTAKRYIKSVSLIVDQNPAPLAAVFHFTPDSGKADVETRLRVDDYTFIHAVAETNDGKLYVSRIFVKAAGGCSAPMGKDAQEALSQLGKMKLQQIGSYKAGSPSLVQLMIRHPNYSGMQMDQLTRLYIPPHYIQSIAVTLDDKPIMTVDADISLSEDPHFRFYYLARHGGDLKVMVKDSKDETFSSDLKVGPQS